VSPTPPFLKRSLTDHCITTNSVAKKVVAERIASGKQRRDMLGSFLAHGLTREEAESEALVQVMAGSDTTATAIRMTMLYLMGNPTAYGALVREIREAGASGFISSPVRDVEARSLPYLQAVLKEGLRVFPPVTGLMSVVVPPGGDVMHGMNIPAGTEIGWTAFGVLRSKGVFGPDADAFRPERWLDAHPDQLKAMTAQWELVFKYGKWQCLGKTVALLELNKVFVEVSLQQLAVPHILSFANSILHSSSAASTSPSSTQPSRSRHTLPASTFNQTSWSGSSAAPTRRPARRSTSTRRRFKGKIRSRAPTHRRTRE
jgi:cytochrome P450